MSVSLVVSILQPIFAVLLIAIVLIQPESSGLSGSFGGPGGIYHAKRGSEKSLFFLTLFLASFFVVSSVLTLIFK